MEKIIEVSWLSQHDEEIYGDAIVEYVCYNEDGQPVKEITNVFLPDGIPADQRVGVADQARENFHSTY